MTRQLSLNTALLDLQGFRALYSNLTLARTLQPLEAMRQ